MDTTITVVQVLLTIFASVAGFGKLLVPYNKLARVAWVNDFKPQHIRLISVLEVFTAVGLAVPLLVPSLAIFAPLAAVGMALVMAGAMATHFRRSEYLNMVGNGMWLVLALFVAYSKLVGLAV